MSRHFLAVPLFFLIVFGSLALLWQIFGLPSGDELLSIIRNFFEKYGLIVVFVSAILEALLFIGWYFPGSTVIFLGVILAAPNPIRAALVVLLVTAGLLIGYTGNYLLGRYGWYRVLLKIGSRGALDEYQRRLERHGGLAIWATYWQPGLASLTSTAAGILNYPFRSFFLHSLAAVAVWDLFWGFIAYFFGEAALSALGIRFILLIIVGVIAIRLIKKSLKA